MKKGLFDRRIPTLFALFILIIVVIISTVLIQSGIFYDGKAAPDTLPQNFSITNISDGAFTVIFTTVGQVDAVVSLTSGSTGNTLILDDRDKKAGTSQDYYSHHITIPNLSPEKRYSFMLIIGGKEYRNTGYVATTAREIASPPPAQNPLFGASLLPDGTPGTDTLVVAKTDGSAVISAVTDLKGEFILPTNSLRNTTHSEYLVVQKENVFTLSFYHQLMKATVNTSFEIAQNLPPVTLLQEYTFQKDTDTNVTTSTSQFNFVEPDTTDDSTVSIRKPRDGEELIDQRPIFSGTSFPNSSIALLIPGVAQQQILSRADGSWSYQTTGNIPQGDHSLTITVTDSEGNKRTDSKSFTIFPLGSQVAESATPSATPTFRPTISPTIQPTTAPTTTAVPTVEATAVPTSLPIITTGVPTSLPTIYQTPTPQPTLSAPGAYENAAVLTGFSIVLIIAGIALLFAL